MKETFVPIPPRRLTRDQARENRVIRAALKSFVEAGYNVQLDDDFEPLPPTADYRSLMPGLRETDYDLVNVFHRTGGFFGDLLLVYGNEPSVVISDYTVNLEDHLAAAMRVSDEIAEFEG
jgi:hypothetical protein